MKRRPIPMTAAIFGTALLLALSGAGFAQENETEADKPADQRKASPQKAEKAEKPEKPEKEAEPADRETGPARKKEAPEKGRRSPKPDAPAPGMVKRAWLGVATQDVAPVLREHLGIPEGFGVQIVHVVPGSPAAEAGLKPADILIRLEDQMLTTHEHLALLVRSKKKGDRVSLAIVRKGDEQTVSVTLDENDVPEFFPRGEDRPFDFRLEPGPDGRGPWHFRGRFDLPDLEGKNWHEALRDYQERFQGWMKNNYPDQFRKRWQPGDAPPMPGCEPPAKPGEEEEKGADSDPAEPRSPEQDREPTAGAKAEIGASVRVVAGSGKPPAISIRSGFPLEVIGGGGMVRIDNPMGEVTIVEKEGRHSIAIKNKNGETVYDGDYDAEKGIEGLPKEAKELLKRMKLTDLQLIAPRTEESGKKIEKKTKTEVSGSF